MSKRALLAALAGAVTSFLAGWVIYGFLLMDYYTANTIVYEGLMKDPPALWGIFVSGFCSSLLFSLIFDKWANIRSFAAGAVAGAWIGFLIMLGFDLSFYSFFNLYHPSLLVVDVLLGTAFNAFIGGVIGFVLGTGKKN